MAAGTLAVLLLALGVARVGGRAAGLIAAAWLATDYVYVMYDRAAIMESLMAAFVVFGWYGFVRAQREPMWGLFAGTAAILAYFTKAAAIFFVAALTLACLWSLVFDRGSDRGNDRDGTRAKGRHLDPCGPDPRGRHRAGRIRHSVVDGYRFYNWQMSVTRKPSYDLRSIVDRIT